MELHIDQSWSFKETVEHLQALKSQYEGILALFYYRDLKSIVKFKKATRDAFYSLNLREYQKDLIWEYMNGFQFLYVLKSIANRQK